MDFTRRIFNYCERAGDGSFWAEPVNALSNGAFWLAALIGLILALRRGRLDGPVGWLLVVLLVIGIGSFLFHTYATVWAAIADSTPIVIFILSFFAIAMRCFGDLSWRRSLALMLGFLVCMVALSALLRPLDGILHGSQSYVPAFAALLGVGIWLGRRGHPAGAWLIGVAAIFAVSLTFRSIDLEICGRLALGTHWLWHLLNSVVLGTLVVTLIRYGSREAQG